MKLSILSACLAPLLILCVLPLTGQVTYEFEEVDGPPVAMVDGTPLPYPFAGGMTAPQWSPIDFDGDGDEDLFCFERDGDRILMFERTPEGWSHRRDWAVGWPEVANWVLLRDYDCDGLPDLFTGYQNSVFVYHNEGGPGANFTAVASPLLASWDFGSGPSDLPIVVLSIDKPAITDIDGDGDLDIITFTETSTTLYSFKGNEPCGLDFTCTNRCYGMVSEGAEDNTLFFGDAFECDFNVANPGMTTSGEDRPETAAERLHAGGAVTFIELDGADRPDLLVSDRVYPTTAALMLEAAEGGLDSVAWLDMAFPSLLPHSGPADSVNCEAFPAGYPLDADGDGDLDLVFSPNTTIESDDDRGVHLWLNVGTADAPEWAFADDDWVQAGMIDVGRNAIPAFVDLNGDGLLDLAVGNKERFEGIGSTPTALAWWRNTGTAEAPAFALVTADAVDFGVNGIESAHPAFGDIDGDGDMDLVVGDELGLLHAYENVAGAGNEAEWVLLDLALTDATGENIDIGQFATPQLLDFNLDGRLDLIVGEKNGTLNLFLNTGSLSAPEWTLATENLGGIQVDNLYGINGYSVPCLFVDEAGIHMYVACETGRIQDFGLWPAGSSDWAQVLPEAPEGLAGDPMPGTRVAAAMADLNNDGLPELAIGVNTGGIRFYQGTGTGVTEVREDAELVVAPSPVVSGGDIQVELAERFLGAGMLVLSWRDAQGQLVQSESVAAAKRVALTAPRTPGMWFLTLESTTGAHLSVAPVAIRVVVVE